MITQVLTPFDSTKQAIEGTTSFRANASYSWSWLIEHSNQQNTLISQINSTTTEMNSLAQTVTTKAQEVANNTTTVNQAKLDAQSARDSAIAANNAAQAIYDTFDDRYLGTKTIAPTLDNDGNALQSGALYFNSTSGKLFIYDLVGVKWVDITTIPTLLSSLSDVAFTTKSNNDVLQYDSATGKWVNRSFYSKAELDAFIAGKIPKITTPTTNALAKINADGTLSNTTIYSDAKNNIGVGQPNPSSKFHVQGNIRTACSGGDTVNTRGIIFDIDGTIHGRLAVSNSDFLLFFGTGIGYGIGGTAVQATSKGAPVTLYKPSGKITMSNSALAAGETVNFVFYCNSIEFNDQLFINPVDGSVADPRVYRIRAASVGSGYAWIRVTNESNSTLSEALQFTYSVFKGAIA